MIGHQNIRPPALLHQLQRCSGTGGFGHLITQFTQLQRCGMAHDLLVVHQQHPKCTVGKRHLGHFTVTTHRSHIAAGQP
ncbi:hypothetical protein D3C73_1373820 [compost metagenome]